MKDQTLYLVGARASGKTSLGRAAASALGRQFQDMDQLFRERTGGEVADHVAAHGWESFRDKEAELLAEVSKRTDGPVVATGGGAVLRPQSREILKAGLTVWLKVSHAELVRRLSSDPLEAQRPSLTGAPVAQEAARIAEEREPLYREVARLVLDGDQQRDALLKNLLEELGGLNILPRNPR